MSKDMEMRLRELAKISDELDPQVLRWTGSGKNAEKWEKLICHLAEVATEDNESGYHCYRLEEEPEHMVWSTFYILNEMGVTIPKTFPEELNFDYDAEDDDAKHEALHDNAYVNVISKIFKSLTDVYGFYAAYFYDVEFDDEFSEDMDDTQNIEPCLTELAASKIEVDTAFAPKFDEFKGQVEKNYKKWLTLWKSKIIRAGIPLRAELMDLLYDSHDELSHKAEAQSFGFNDSRLHPDIYMNELLQGMRTIHQALPAIMKKLKMKEKDFTLDTSELRLGESHYAAAEEESEEEGVNEQK